MTALFNPYVGPRSFDEKDRRYFFGRQEEISRLRSLAIARRAVLLYSPSGAGKSSLLQAGLLPELRSVPGVACLPVARVSGEIPEGLRVANVFVFHLLSYLLGDAEPEEIAPLPLTAGLDRALAALAAAPGEPHEEAILTIDQLEEIFSTEPHRQAERDDFFRQLHDALEARRELTLILALREDWLAHLDPHLSLLPDRLRTRFRLGLLSPAQALTAVTEPAAKAETPFRPEVARRLVDDLRRAQSLAPDGTPMEHLGEHVDPVQLQVVCRRLWERRPAEATEIDEAQVHASGDVDHALAAYYSERAAAAAASAGVPERRVRDWCERALITPQGIRGQVLRGPEQTQGLDNRAVGELVDAHLVRAEPRRGAVWYELAHDRLIRPVQDDNAAWLRQHESALEKRAALWEAEGRPPRLLLLGRPLTAAQKEAESLGPEPPRVVVDFLAASRQRQRVRRKWRFWIGLSGGGLLVVLVGGMIVGGLIAVLDFTFSLSQLRLQASAAQTARVDRSLLLALGAFEMDGLIPDNAQANHVRAFLPDPRAILAENLAASSALETILYGPEHRNLMSVAWSPDGRRLLAGSVTGAIHTWELSTGRPEAPLPGKHDGWVEALAYAPDGRSLASAGYGGSILLRDARDGRVLRKLAGEPGSDILVLRFTPDGRTVHAITRSGTVWSWDPATGGRLRPPRRGPAAACAAFSPEGSVYALASISGADLRTHVLATASGLPIGPPLPGPPVSLAFSPDGRTLATGSSDGTLTLFDTASGAPRGGPVRAAAGMILRLAFSPRGDLLAVGSSSGGIQLWDPATLQPVSFLFTGLGGNLQSLAFSPDGTRLASAHEDRIAVWFPQKKPFLGEPAPLPPVAQRALTLRQDAGLLALYGEREGKTGLVLWTPGETPPTGEPVRIDGDISVLAFSPDGGLLAAGGAGGPVWLFDPATGRPFGPPWSGHQDRVTALAFDPAGRLLLSAGLDRRLVLREVASGALRTTATLESAAFAVALHPGGTGFVSGDVQGSVSFRDLSGRLRRESWKACWNAVQSLSYTPDGKTLIAGCQEGTVEIFREGRQPDGDEVHSLPGHSGPVIRLAFAPDGNLLATAGLDGGIFLWDVSIPRVVAGAFRGHSGTIQGLAFDRTGKTLLSIGNDGWSVRWDVDAASWRRLACRRANRNLEDDEWARDLPSFIEPLKLCPGAPERPQE